MQDIICAICGTNQQKELLYEANFSKKDLTSKTFSARRQPDKIHYQLNKCRKCGLIFSSPILKTSQIETLYKKSYNSYPKQIDFLKKTYYEIFEKIVQKTPKNPKVLEIGCGDGFFLKELKSKGFNNLFGIEPSKKMVARMPNDLKKNTRTSVYKGNLFEKGFFDVICCFHTLDHVTDPKEVVSGVFRNLKKGGVALFVVHDTNALSVKIFGENSPIFDIEHIYLFNKSSLARIFKDSGFKRVRVLDLKNTYPLSYWIRMAGINSIVKKVLLNIVMSLKLDNIKISLKGGNICLTAEKNNSK